MKAILIYDLDDEDDIRRYRLASQAQEIRDTLDATLAELRRQWKHGDNEVLNDYAQRISDIIYRELDDNGVTAC